MTPRERIEAWLRDREGEPGTFARSNRLVRAALEIIDSIHQYCYCPEPGCAAHHEAALWKALRGEEGE